MNDVETFLRLGAGLQIASLVISVILWPWRQTRFAQLGGLILLMSGATGAILGALFPSSELFVRVGISYLPQCLNIIDCRADVIFSANWIGLIALGFAAQVIVYRLCLRRP